MSCSANSHLGERLCILMCTTLKDNMAFRYPEIREVELRYTLAHWTTIRASKDMETKITEIAQGKHPHADETLKVLMTRVVAP